MKEQIVNKYHWPGLPSMHDNVCYLSEFESFNAAKNRDGYQYPL